MCGSIGLIFADKNAQVAQAVVDGLTILQHRGQDAGGILTSCGSKLNMLKNNGIVADVFTQENIVTLLGNIGIGHNRYPTAGSSRACEAQPMYTNFPFGIGMAHNGNLTNTSSLAAELQQHGRHVNTDSDSEVLLNVFAEELNNERNKHVTPDCVFAAAQKAMTRCKGAFAVVALIHDVGLLAFRDPHGIRPLCFGARKSAHGTDYAIASESVAIDALDPHFDFRLVRDVHAGEAILISTDNVLHTKQLAPDACLTPCLFEYVYFARPDSIIDGVQVNSARGRMGEKLAQRVLQEFGTTQLDIDVVMPVPETSRTAALACAHILSRPYREGLVKNRYIARTFIMPGQTMRRKTVRLKLNCIKSEFAGKTVLLIDDSIVRGTTAVELVQMARDAGAKRVYFASAAPPVRYVNVYGIDIPTRCELVAYGRSVEEICTFLKADRVFYNTLEDTEQVVCSLRPHTDSRRIAGFESSCFSGRYITPEVTLAYLESVEAQRGRGRTGASSSSRVSSELGWTTSPACETTTGGDGGVGCESIHNAL